MISLHVFDVTAVRERERGKIEKCEKSRSNWVRFRGQQDQETSIKLRSRVLGMGWWEEKIGTGRRVIGGVSM